MSWLTDLTSKAETFLNKIDQSAAQTFNDSNASPDEPQQRIGEIKIDAQLYNPPVQSTKETPPISPINSTFHNQNNLNRSADAKLQNGPSSKRAVISQESNLYRSSSSPSLKKQDALLFEFLNSANPVTTTKGHIRNLSGPKTSTPHKTLTTVTSATPSQQIIPTQHQDQKIDNDSVEMAPSQNIDVKVEPPLPPPPAQKDPEYIETQQSADHIITNKKHSNENKVVGDRISNLELENKLLKNEMQSLNEELASTLTRLKGQQEEADKYKLRYENRRNQQNQDYERIQQEYENKQGDLNEALKAKDMQLAVLRVRIQEVDTELKNKSEILQNVQAGNERMLKDHSDASGVQGVALNSLRDKVEQTENELRREQNENNIIKSELMNLQTKLQNDQHQYVETIKQLQAKQHEGKDKCRELESRVKNAEVIVETSRKELKDYKDKAARILQAKEKLIASLKQGGELTELSPLLLSELEETKQERDILREELQQNRYKTEQLRSEYLDLELLHNTETDDNQEKIESLQSTLQEEVQKRKHAEEDMKRYMQELQFTQEDLHKVKKTQITHNQQHEAEMKRMQHQMTVKQSTNSSQEELENRIRTLTDSLIHKQTVVETLSTEKNSLVLQLERLEKQYHDVQNSLNRRNKESHPHDIEDPDGAARLQPMASIMPTQITQSKRWKKTVNDIDRFSIRLGVFLRRYPAARLMVLAYMLILHLWVTFVLLTYTPEIHPPEMQRQLPS